MKTLELDIDYEPFEPWQADFHLSESKEKVAVTGARGGKTEMGVHEVLDAAIEQPGYHPQDIRRREPYSIMVGARDYGLIYRVIQPRLLNAVPHALKIGKYHHTRHLLKVHGRKGQTWIWFQSGWDPGSLQGLKLYRVWFDEFPLLKEQVYDEVKSRLLDRNGTLILTGTPQGPNWAKKRIYDRWLERNRQNGPDLYFTTWKTIDNPRLPSHVRESLIEKKRLMPPAYFARTFEASFDVFAGQIYEELRREVHCYKRADYTFILPSRRRQVGKGSNKVVLSKVVGGVDWGFSEGHLGVILVFGYADGGMNGGPGRWYLLHESTSPNLMVSAPSIAEDSWVNRALTLQTHWEVDTFFCDPSSPQNMAQLKRNKVHVQSADNSVKPGIQLVASLLHLDPETGDPSLYLVDDATTTYEHLAYYHWKEGREEPVKVMDDCCDALRYALYTFSVRGTFERQTGWSPGKGKGRMLA